MLCHRILGSHSQPSTPHPHTPTNCVVCRTQPYIQIRLPPLRISSLWRFACYSTRSSASWAASSARDPLSPYADSESDMNINPDKNCRILVIDDNRAIHEDL